MANWHIRVVILLLQGEIICTMHSSYNNFFCMAFTASEFVSVPVFQKIKESGKKLRLTVHKANRTYAASRRI